jgi:hypothetical protein
MRAWPLRSRGPALSRVDHLLDCEAVGAHDRFGRTVAAAGEQLERAAAVGLGAAAESRHLAGGLSGWAARLPDSRTSHVSLKFAA